MYVVDRRCWPIHCMHFFQLPSEFVGHKAGRGHPQYNEGNLTVSLATARHVEVWKLGLRSQGVKFCSDGGPHLSSRDAQSVFETILPARPAAVRLLGRDACALHSDQSFSTWRTGSSTPRMPGRSPWRHQQALLCSPLLQDISWNEPLSN